MTVTEDRDEATPKEGTTGGADQADAAQTSHEGEVGRWPWRRWLRSAGTGVAVLLAFSLGVCVAGGGEDADVESTDEHAEHAAAEDDTIWTCSMHPQIRMEEPGQCPICGMDLVPAESEEGAASDVIEHVTLSKQARALAQLRTTEVVRTDPKADMRLLGRVDYDETRFRMITPWVAGRIENLAVRVTGAKIRKGQVVATLYSPEVYAAMRDLVLADRQLEKLSGGVASSQLMAKSALEAARERLRLLGMTDSMIANIEKTGDAPKTVPIRATHGGTVLERMVEEGDYVAAGTVLYHVADLSTVWVQIDAYESDLPHLSVGQTVMLEIDSIPDERFEGKVSFIDPVLNPQTRTAKVRVAVPNPKGRLRPGMFAQAVVEGEVGGGTSYLVSPASAVLFTGRRSVVYVETPGHDGTYELREVRLGPKAGPVYPVLEGLSEGERVVSRGAFVVDADLQLKGGRSMMTLPDDESSTSPRLQVSEEMLDVLRPVVEQYLRVQQHLAADELDQARSALGELAAMVNTVDLPGPVEAAEAWSARASALAGHARHAVASKEPGELRSAFEKISAEVVTLLRVFGNPTEAELSIAFCPMAFDEKGAQWVQREGAVANPYYGSAMLRCGDAKATVAPTERLATRETPPPPSAPTQHVH